MTRSFRRPSPRGWSFGLTFCILVCLSLAGTHAARACTSEGTLDAEFVSQDVRTTMVASTSGVQQKYSVSITMRNTGTACWDPAADIALKFRGSFYGLDENFWAASQNGTSTVRIPIDNWVSTSGPTSTFTFEFDVLAPEDIDSHPFEWRMVKPGTQDFPGPSPGVDFGELTDHVAIDVTAPVSLDSSFESQTVPSTMSRGLPETASVTLVNRGTTSWLVNQPSTSYVLEFQATAFIPSVGDDHWGVFRVPTPHDVLSGESVTFSFDIRNITRQDLDDLEPFKWRMVQVASRGDQAFGESTEQVDIEVTDDLASSFEDQRLSRIMAMGSTTPRPATFRFTNTGSVPWDQGEVVLKAIHPGGLASDFWGSASAQIPLPVASVAPSEEVTFSLDLFPPTAQAGHFPGEWQLATTYAGADDFAFGDASATARIEVSDMSEVIQISGGEFVEGSRTWTPAGMNMLLISGPPGPCPSARGAWDAAWCLYDPTEVEAALDDLATSGVNTIRMGLPGGIFETAPETFDMSVCDDIDHLMDSAADRGMRMVFSSQRVSRYAPWMQDKDYQPRATDSLCDANGGPGYANNDCLDYDHPIRKVQYVSSEVMDFLSRRLINVIDQCGLENRPEIFSFRILDEPQTSLDDRKEWRAVGEWASYLGSEYPGSDPIGQALQTYGFTPAEITAIEQNQANCGRSGDQLCPPPLPQFCNEGTGPYAEWTKDYLKFYNQRLATTYAAMINQVKAHITAQTGSSMNLFTTATSGTFFKGPTGFDKACDNMTQSGHWADPGILRSALDYPSINVYPFDGTSSDPVIFETQIEQRQELVSLMAEYARGTLDTPLVIQEYGHVTCLRAENDPSTCHDAGLDLQDYDTVQKRGFEAIVETLNERSIHGGLWFLYREAYVDYGTLDPNFDFSLALQAVDGTPRTPFLSDPELLPTLTADEKEGRDVLPAKAGCLDVTRSNVFFESNLFDVLTAYQALEGNGWVELRDDGTCPP